MKVSGILDIFAKSPFKPMQQHMGIVLECSACALPFMEQVISKNWQGAEDIKDKIMQLESDADELKKDIRLHLPNSLFMPVARSDVLELLTAQDKIASKVKHIVGLVVGRKMEFPEVIRPYILEYIQRSLEALELANLAINELDELVDTGFGGREAKLVEKMITQLDQVERDTDRIQQSLRQKLFEIEQDLFPINVIFMYKTIDWIAEMADRAQHVGQKIESLLAN